MLKKRSTSFSASSPWEFSVGQCTDPKQRSFQHLTSFSLTSHHSKCLGTAFSSDNNESKFTQKVSTSHCQNTWLIAFDPQFSDVSGQKGTKEGKKKRDLGGTEWDCWYNMLLMLFRLCGWRLCRWMLRLCNKSTPHACTEDFIRPKSASVKWLKVDSPAGSMTWGPRP